MLLGADDRPRPTIFAEMSALATASGAINLGQGFPDEDGPAELLDAAAEAIHSGRNQYAPGIGVPELRASIAAHQQRFYGLVVDPDREVLATAGATEALTATLLALLEPGDEVVTFEPFYDLYAAVIALAGARHRTVPLTAPDFAPDLDRLRDAFTERTRIVLVNTPHNPTGAVLPRATLELIVELAERHGTIIVTDEVYEHLTFTGPHVPIASLPGAAERTVTISSAAKTFSVTGWKVGWLTGPVQLVEAIDAVKQFLTFANATPLQVGVARALGLPDAYFIGIAEVLRGKRDLLSSGLAAAGFGVSPSHATYYVVADAAPLGFDDGAEFCRRLPDLAGVVGVPITAFVTPEHHAGYASLVRFAFCKRVEVLEEAVARLSALTR